MNDDIYNNTAEEPEEGWLADTWPEKPVGSMSFEEYMREHAIITDNPSGDFVEDSRFLIELGRFTPKNSWRGIRWFLGNRHACSEAMKAGYEVYGRYRVFIGA